MRKMKIGWIIPTVGTFGAVREMVEVSNVLIRRGHRVSIYHPDGGPCVWLPCLAECKRIGTLINEDLDALIGIVDWKPELYHDLLNAKAKVKAICLLGFNPTDEMASALRGDTKTEDQAEKIIRDAMQRKFMVLADSSWQVDWVRKKVGYRAGPAFGGINLKMFCPGIGLEPENPYRIIHSGDPRDRKGTDTVLDAIDILKSQDFINVEYDHYWNRRLNQEQLVQFLQRGDIFLDGHRRAGWCNPVAEAIACGAVPVCTNIGAVRDFAIHEETALTVPVDDAEKMAAEAIRLMGDDNLRMRLAQNGLKLIQRFSYDVVVPQLEAALEKRIYG